MFVASHVQRCLRTGNKLDFFRSRSPWDNWRGADVERSQDANFENTKQTNEKKIFFIFPVGDCCTVIRYVWPCCPEHHGDSPRVVTSATMPWIVCSCRAWKRRQGASPEETAESQSVWHSTKVDRWMRRDDDDATDIPRLVVIRRGGRRLTLLGWRQRFRAIRLNHWPGELLLNRIVSIDIIEYARKLVLQRSDVSSLSTFGTRYGQRHRSRLVRWISDVCCSAQAFFRTAWKWCYRFRF